MVLQAYKVPFTNKLTALIKLATQQATSNEQRATSNERSVRKVIHSDAKLTCKKREDVKNIIVIEEVVEKTEKTGKTEGFAAVAGAAVSLAGKYFSAESVRGSLVFKCDK